MNQLLCKIPCQSTSKVFNNSDIYIKFFDKDGRLDKRYLEGSIQRFVTLNKKMFDFLGVNIEFSGIDNNLSLSFRSSNYVGAIPIKMPYDGLIHKDFQVIPRFDNGKDAYSELTQLLSCLSYSIRPEYSDTDVLCLPMQLKPPTYYEAVKYVDLFEKAYKYMWVKFHEMNKIHPYPKASTDWSKYISMCGDPQKTLIFPSRDSVLTTNHKEWQELRYVFDIAKEQVINSTVPGAIRFRYYEQIISISNKVTNVMPLPTDEVVIRLSDPQCIKDVKEQANIILKKSSSNCAAWRIDMAELFERYVQHIIDKSVRELSGTVIPNTKITGRGKIPAWGLKYLEPDVMVKVGDCMYVADAKYKANFYAGDVMSEVLKETHRADLHQLLAYCSFEPQFKKVGILFYPSQKTFYKDICYTEKFSGRCNKVILCGLAFGVAEMNDAISEVKELFQRNVLVG